MAASRTSKQTAVPWRRGSSEEESRAYLQTRLTTLFKLLFWCFVAVMAFVAVAYHINPSTRPAQQGWVYAAFAVGIALLAFMWRVLLLRTKPSFARLHQLDILFAVGGNAIIAFCAVVSNDQRQAAYTCFIYTCWTVLTRALIVPSTGKRTAIVTAIALVPMGLAVVYLTEAHTWQYLMPGQKDVPGPALIVGYLQIASVAVLLASQGSRIIYDLNDKASAVQQLGQYKLGRVLGEGGNGKVYLAHHVLLRRPTAIKVVPAAKVGVGSLARFEREVHYMSQLTHPNTVAVYDYGHSDGVFYYAMEYLGGGIDLQRLIDRHGRQPAERVRQILIQVCSALQEAHDAQIVHRDIKPGNIILCERGGLPDVAKVVDYGLVKELASDSAGASTQIVLGTPAYIAPEAVAGASTIGPGVDLYAVGAVGYFLLSAQRVFTGTSDLDVCVQHVTKAPPSFASHGVTVPAPLEAIIMRCLAKTPAERHPSAVALADALRELGSLDDWDDARAAAWWTAHRPDELADNIADVATTTISINLEGREEAA